MEKIPFDLDAFKNGAVAIDEYGREVRFLEIIQYHDGDEQIKTSTGATMFASYVALGVSYTCKWTMKPVETEGEWIPHDGGLCPIPWAGVDDYEIKLSDGETGSLGRDAIKLRWNHIGMVDIVAYRLLDGWIPVKGDGAIPDAIKDAKSYAWEYKYRTGENYPVTAGYAPSEYAEFKHNGSRKDIVAVRLRKPVEAVKVNKITEAQEVELQSSGSLISNPPIEQKVLDRISDTLEAYFRFRASPRGKEALASIGVVENPFVPMRHDEQFDIARDALLAHDKVWPRKQPRLCSWCNKPNENGLCDKCNSELPF